MFGVISSYIRGTQVDLTMLRVSQLAPLDLLGPMFASFRALSEGLEFAVRHHKSDEDSRIVGSVDVQKYLAHKKTPTHLGPP